jgi:hypothetical protein
MWREPGKVTELHGCAEASQRYQYLWFFVRICSLLCIVIVFEIRDDDAAGIATASWALHTAHAVAEAPEVVESVPHP